MVRRYLLLVVLLASATSMSIAGITGILAGKITDKSGSPVAGATIKVVGTTRGGYSKADGKYTIVNINSGTYDVRVTAVGYDTVVKRLTIIADQTLTADFRLSQGGVTLGTLDVTAERQMVRSTDVGTNRQVSGKEITKIGRDNLASALSLQAGVRASGNNFVIRGGRTNETQVMVDGLTVTDQFTGGLGNVGSTISAAMPSPLAVEEVQVQTGGFTAEYGNAVAGNVNSVVKTGRIDRYDGQVRWRKDVPFLYGFAGNGVQLGANHEDVADVAIGGPLGLGRSTFFLSIRNTYQQFRNPSLMVLDPIGNNLGQLPNNRTWSRNITGRMRFSLDDDMALVAGGSYGMLVGELSSQAWLYATTKGRIQTSNGVLELPEERIAKQPIVQEYPINGFVQLNHSLSNNTFYEVKGSYNYKYTEIGRRKNSSDGKFLPPGIFSGVELYNPTDTLALGPNGYVRGSNGILDEFDAYRGDTTTSDGKIRDWDVTKINPVTGYYEGPADPQSTANPYGLQNFFYIHGNTSDVEMRSSIFYQIDGNITHTLESGDTRHTIKGGFEFRSFDLSLYQNLAPEQGDQFSQSYGTRHYTDTLRTKPSRTPITGSMFVQDQIMMKGLVLTAGLRMDYLNPSANVFNIGRVEDSVLTASPSLRLSPRLSVVYPTSDDNRSNFSVSYGIYYQNPVFSNLFDNVYVANLDQTDFYGSPSLPPQRTNQFQIAYNNQLNDVLAISVTGYYNDIYNQPSILIKEYLGRPKFQYDLASYGNSRGIELSFVKRLADNWQFNINYTISSVRGNVQGATSVPPVDPITGEYQFPLNDFPLPQDIPQRVNAVVGFTWGKDEGPSIAGVSFLENLSVNLSGFWQSGGPYTPVNIRGQIAGQLNSARFPSFWDSELRLIRTIPLEGVFGGKTAVDLILDVNNIFNFVDAVSFYTTTRNPDFDGNNLNRRPSDITTGVTYYAKPDPLLGATVSPSQYDRYGNRLYQSRIDYNSDGRVTPEESYRGYLDYVQVQVDRRPNYRAPRQVFFALAFRF